MGRNICYHIILCGEMAITFSCILNQVECRQKTFTSEINKEFKEVILKPRVSTSTPWWCAGPGQVRYKNVTGVFLHLFRNHRVKPIT